MDTAGSKVDEIYITDWIALENIVAHGDFDRKYLEKIIHDVCEQKSDSECLEPCAIYETYMKKCVSKLRIKQFNASKEITGKNGKLYKIIDAKKYDIETVNPAFYFMFESLESNIYIIFSSGIGSRDYFIQFKNELTSLVEKIYIQHHSKKIILCGHSSGCVFSIYTGMIMKDKYNDFFDSNVIIVGSAPFKYSNDVLINFSYLPNVKIFANSIEISKLIENSEISDLIGDYNPSQLNKEILYADIFITNGPCKYNYEPITYITQDYNIITGKHIVRPITKIVEDLSPNKNTSISPLNFIAAKFHDWTTYYDNLINIYGKNLPWVKYTQGGEKSRKTPNRRRTPNRRKIPKYRKTRKHIRPIVQQHKSSRKHTSKLGTSSIRKRLTKYHSRRIPLDTSL